MNDTQITMRVTAALDKKIRMQAAREGLSKAAWIRKTIIALLKAEDK